MRTITIASLYPNFFCWMGTYLHQLTLGDLHLLIFNAIDLLFLVRVDTEPC